MVNSDFAWTGCLALAAVGCCLGCLLALTSRRALSVTVLAISLTGMALALAVRPSQAPPPLVEGAADISTEAPAVTVVIPPEPAAPEPSSGVEHPIPVELSPPLPPEPVAQPPRPAPQYDTTAPTSNLSPVQAGLLGAALPGGVTLVVLCTGPAWARRRRSIDDRRQWRALLELARILQAQMSEPDVCRIRLEDPHRYAQLSGAQELALSLLEPRPPRYNRRHLALRDLAAPQAVYAWADQLNAVRRDLSEP